MFAKKMFVLRLLVIASVFAVMLYAGITYAQQLTYTAMPDGSQRLAAIDGVPVIMGDMPGGGCTGNTPITMGCNGSAPYMGGCTGVATYRGGCTGAAPMGCTGSMTVQYQAPVPQTYCPNGQCPNGQCPPVPQASQNYGYSQAVIAYYVPRQTGGAYYQHHEERRIGFGLFRRTRTITQDSK